MKRARQIVPPVVAPVAALLAALLVSGVASADPERLSGRWVERWGVFQRRTVRFELVRDGEGWRAEARSPRRGAPHRLTLVRSGGAGARSGADVWTLRLEQRATGRGLSEVLEEEDGGWRWTSRAEVTLRAKGRQLEGKDDDSGAFLIELPTDAPAADGAAGATASAPSPEAGPGELGEGSSSALPVVRVLITGFDRFPRPVNHPHWVGRGTDLEDREAQINPSGWSVRNFDAASLDPALRQRVRIELHRLTDVPVVYVEGARTITERIAAVDADVCISTGVGSGGNVDADVESTCTNLMHDGSGLSGEGEGPFQLPASWPPAGPESSWSPEDRAWLWRYPDNAGVSYNRKPIDPTRPERLRSSLPVGQIVSRAQGEGLRAHDGQGGPGNYICNNVMFKVVDTQASRGRIGGFIHLAQWNERKQQDYLKVLRVAIEESVKAFLERPSN